MKLKLNQWVLLSVATAALATFPGAPAMAAESENFRLPDRGSPELDWWRDSIKTHDERIAWGREARFGMFGHWGVYSGLGNSFHGRKRGGYTEHIHRRLKIPHPGYRAAR